MGKVIGIDLGGTKIAAIMIDTETEARSGQMTVATEAKTGPDAVIRRIAQVVREVCAKEGVALADLAGLGVGVPGTVDINTGCTLLLPNLPGEWRNKPVVDMLHADLNCPVAIINDARAFTLAEATLGAGRGAHTVACFTLGTGIGGGIAINGRLHLGLAAAAGEFGHQTINFDGPADGSGNRGGLEAYCSGPAIAAMGVKVVMQGITSKIGELVDFDLNRITPEVIMNAAELGDTLAIDILDKAGHYIGTGIANVVTILAPDRVIIGGGVARLGDWLMKPALRTIHERCHTVPLDQFEIVYAQLGGDAGAIGAALWAAQTVISHNGASQSRL